MAEQRPGELLSDPYDVKNQVVLITGAGRGIGRGIVRVFAAGGARVAVNALTETHVEPLAAELREAGAEVRAYTADVTDSGQVDALVARVLEDFGGIDVLINNLGDSRRGWVAAGADGDPPMSDEVWRAIMAVNLTHAFYCSRAVGRQMLERGAGRVINISSFAARTGGKRLAAYTAAKTGLAGLTRALALEWAPAVQVNAIAPGSFPDAEVLSADELAGRDAEAAGSVPLGRVGRPVEVGYLARYLASPAAAYMTGETLYLTGGRGL